MNGAPIGIFDSGMGGLSVFRELEKLLPDENLIYFGDTARVPYGTRSAETIKKFVRGDVGFLNSFKPKLIVVACGTASCVGAPVLEECCENYVSVISPSAISAVKHTENKKIGVISTDATLRSGAFENKIKQLMPDAEVFSKGCQFFVNVVESGWIDENNEIAKAVAKEYLSGLKTTGIDTLILGCTHFPLLSKVIQNEIGKNVRLINSGYETALAAMKKLKESGQINDSGTGGYRKYFVSDGLDSFCNIAELFLGHEVRGEVSQVEIK